MRELERRTVNESLIVATRNKLPTKN
jgi:hypothetical protein